MGEFMDNAFPIRPEPDDDARFDISLMSDVRDVLIEHGYPSEWTGFDFVELQQALYRFIYKRR